jgi:hypothetical protein
MPRTFPEFALHDSLAAALVERHDTRLGTTLSPPSYRRWAGQLSGMSFADVERVALDAVKATVLNDALDIDGALVLALAQQKTRRALTTKTRRR